MSRSADDELDGIKCEWCDNPARLKLPMMRRIKGSRGGMTPSGMHIFACYQHEEIAKELANRGS